MTNEVFLDAMLDTTHHVSTPNAENGLLDLPAELNLKILEKLPAKEIQRLRGVCKRLKAFVDSHKVDIANTKIEQEKRRIIDYTNYYVFYTDSPTMLERLSRWSDTRGIWRCNVCSTFLQAQFTSHTVSTLPFNTFNNLMPRDPAIQLDDLILALHVLFYDSPIFNLVTPGPVTDQATLDANLDQLVYALPPLGTNVDQLVHALSLLGTQHSHAEIHEYHDKNEHCTASMPRFPVTTLRVCEHHLVGTSAQTLPLSQILSVDKRGICAQSALSSICRDLPLLPRPIHNTGNIFAYCLKSEAMHGHLRNALTLARLGREIDRIFKAAIMEDLYVF